MCAPSRLKLTCYKASLKKLHRAAEMCLLKRLYSREAKCACGAGFGRRGGGWGGRCAFKTAVISECASPSKKLLR